MKSIAERNLKNKVHHENLEDNWKRKEKKILNVEENEIGHDNIIIEEENDRKTKGSLLESFIVVTKNNVENNDTPNLVLPTLRKKFFREPPLVLNSTSLDNTRTQVNKKSNLKPGGKSKVQSNGIQSYFKKQLKENGVEYSPVFTNNSSVLVRKEPSLRSVKQGLSEDQPRQDSPSQAALVETTSVGGKK